MIEKLNGLRHLKISSNLKRDQKNNGNQGHSNQEQSQKHHEKESVKEQFNVSPFDVDEIIKKLNDNKYYQNKGMTFEFQSNHDGDVVIVKSKDKIIQRLTPSKAFNLLKRINSGEKDTPIKGGILNIKL
tara:strand:- start:27861 stop:28247 length:387 start_codon:yes stop_codon:yes gene_type:complete